MLTQRRLSLTVLTAIAVLSSAYSARATQAQLVATTFTGYDTSVLVLLDDAGGNITVTLTVNEGVADLRGFFLNIQNSTPFTVLDVLGDDVTSWDTHGVTNLGHGVNLNGDGSPCPCDIGVEIGTPGIGKDDIFSTTFVIDASTPLTLDDFAGELLGVRLTSVGAGDPLDAFNLLGLDRQDSLRNGSSKLVATIPDPIIPIPEPSTALLIAVGLGSLGYAGRGKR